MLPLLAAAMAMLIVFVSLCGVPSVTVCRSSALMISVADEPVSSPELNVKPFRAVLIAETVPTNRRLRSSVPVPCNRVRPVSCDKLIAPRSVEIVTMAELLSVSAIEMALPPESVSVSPGATVCAPGTVMIGASFTSPSVTVKLPSTNCDSESVARTTME